MVVLVFFDQAFGGLDAGELIGEISFGKNGGVEATGGEFDPGEADLLLVGSGVCF